MFKGVDKKLERVEHFLNNLKALADKAGGFPYIKRTKQQEMRANLDGFFFEVISAKDFFLQGVNDKFAGLPRDEATKISKLKHCLSSQSTVEALKVVEQLEKGLSDSTSWLWAINNYRNSATHRELLGVGHKATIPLDRDTIEKIQQGKYKIKLIYEGEERDVPPGTPRVNVPRENIKTYLFKDPEDPTKGNADIEVIPYCEQSLTKMRELLERLYSELGLE